MKKKSTAKLMLKIVDLKSPTYQWTVSESQKVSKILEQFEEKCLQISFQWKGQVILSCVSLSSFNKKRRDS